MEVCNSLIPKIMLELSLMRTECLQPGERKLVEVESKSFVWDPGEEIEASPLSSIPRLIELVPCVNVMTENQTKVMMVNTTSKRRWMKQGSIVATVESSSKTTDYGNTVQLQNAATKIPTPESRTPTLKDEHDQSHIQFCVNRLLDECLAPGKEDQEAEPSDKGKNAAVVSEVEIPDEFNIMKKPLTISSEELIKKFELDHLPPSEREKVIELILKFRRIWSEHSFDLGLYNQVEHNIVLTKPLPPCPKQRFWPANRREAAEELINNLEKHLIVEKCIADWATNIVLIKK